MRSEADAPVLIVGAGPVGLTAALLLDRFGIRSTVLERATAFGHHPKARGIRLRTMELLRQWGFEPELRARALPGETAGFIYCTSVAGEEIARTPPPPEDPADSPTTFLRVAQDALEAALRARVAGRPRIDVRLGTEVEALDTDGLGVITRAGTGAIRSRYVIAADGVASTARRALGIELEGPPLLGWWQSIFWRGEIGAQVAGRNPIQFVTGSGATVAAVDGHSRWITLVPQRGEERPEAPSREAAAALVRGAVGVKTDIEILDTTTWRLSAQIARRFSAGPVFLAGDAAHVLPPTGGFGMNLGVQDVHNLVWKLAGVLRGWADPAVLETYDEERRSVAQASADWSVENSRRFATIRAAIASGDGPTRDLALREQAHHVGARDRDIGFHYASGAFIADGTAAPVQPAGRYIPSARPGHRAPHLWLTRGGDRISSLDLFDDAFVLLTDEDGDRWRAGARAVAPSVPLRVYRVGAELRGDVSMFRRLYGLGQGGAVLVRPDGHVAYRRAEPVTDPAAELRGALAAILDPMPAAGIGSDRSVGGTAR